MPRVDFYILPDHSPATGFACAMAGKIWRQGHKIHIRTGSRQDAVILDEMLWTHKDISYLPHQLADEQEDPDTPVNIGWNGLNPVTDEVLINLGDNIPDYAPSFARIIEIVPATDPQRGLARERFRKYREQGFDIHSHKLEDKHVRI
jgi:DNA polymerase-3 subunit chi